MKLRIRIIGKVTLKYRFYTKINQYLILKWKFRRFSDVCLGLVDMEHGTVLTCLQYSMLF
jgi:hypothetical protein